MILEDVACANVPDFFQPQVMVSDTAVSVDFMTWDCQGNQVRVCLGARLGVDPVANNRTLEAIVASAWQAVWLAAQSDGQDLNGPLEFHLPKETMQ